MSKQKKEIIPPKGSKLFVDIGNSSLKSAYLKDGVWQHPHLEEMGLHTASDFTRWVNRNVDRLDLIMITSVVAEVTEALTNGIRTSKYRVLTEADIPRELLDYETPDTLGLDRFFGCYGAVTQTRKSAVVIDAGSACTVDFMAADFLYRGGVIMPGLSIIEEACQEKLPALPSVEQKIPGTWPGKSTKESLQWGITGSFVFAIEEMLQRYRESFGAYNLVATGGGAGKIAKLLRPSTEVKVRPSLVFDGMKEFIEDHLP